MVEATDADDATIRAELVSAIENENVEAAREAVERLWNAREVTAVDAGKVADGAHVEVDKAELRGRFQIHFGPDGGVNARGTAVFETEEWFIEGVPVEASRDLHDRMNAEVRERIADRRDRRARGRPPY